jgi:hypothetical protein
MIDNILHRKLKIEQHEQHYIGTFIYNNNIY